MPSLSLAWACDIGMRWLHLNSHSWHGSQGLARGWLEKPVSKRHLTHCLMWHTLSKVSCWRSLCWICTSERKAMAFVLISIEGKALWFMPGYPTSRGCFRGLNMKTFLSFLTPHSTDFAHGWAPHLFPTLFLTPDVCVIPLLRYNTRVSSQLRLLNWFLN